MSVLQSRLWLPGSSEAQSSRSLPEVFQKAGEERDPAALPLRSQSRGGLGAREEETTATTRRHQYPRAILQGLLLGQVYQSLHKRHFWDLTLGLRKKEKVNRANPFPPSPLAGLTLSRPRNPWSFCCQIPETYLEMSKGLGRYGIVPVIVLKAP